MKKLFLALSLCVFAGTFSSAQEVFADDYIFQKQLIAQGKNYQEQCQTFRIHQNWFITAAHCVDRCKKDATCQVKILLAHGPVNAWVPIDRREIFVPKQYRPVEATPSQTIPKSWDVALIHHQPGEEETPEQTIPVLYVHGGYGLMDLNLEGNDVEVPWWENGKMQLFTGSKKVLYFGGKQSMWSSCGFGLNPGNSGGAVTLKNGGIIGVVTATVPAGLAAKELKEFPCYRTEESFLFNGFAPKTTLKFIEKTMGRYGDGPTVERFGM